MALSTNKIKGILNGLKNGNNKVNVVWKPEAGTKSKVRIVPYQHNPEQFSFIELKFHYGLKVKDASGKITPRTYLSPDTFNRPDPIVEFANRLMKTGNKEDWKRGRSYLPKARTYAPIIVRGKENEGIKFWGFGKTVYETLLNACDPEVMGDISDVKNGHDIIVEYTEASGVGSFPNTTITVQGKSTPALPDDQLFLLDNQKNILELFPEPTYEELYNVMTAMFTLEEGDESSEPLDGPEVSASVTNSSENSPATDEQFEKLFGKKN